MPRPPLQHKPRKGAKQLAEFVSTSKRRTHCMTCNDAVVAKLCDEFVALRRAKKTQVWQSWQWFIETYLRKELGLEVRYRSVLRHVRECLHAVDRGGRSE